MLHQQLHRRLQLLPQVAKDTPPAARVNMKLLDLDLLLARRHR